MDIQTLLIRSVYHPHVAEEALLELRAHRERLKTQMESVRAFKELLQSVYRPCSDV